MVSFIALLLRKQTNENSYPVYTCTMGIRQFHKYFPVLNYGQLEREEREREWEDKNKDECANNTKIGLL